MTQGVTGTTSSAYSSQSSSSANSGSDVSKDEFLKLLTYQLKAQNPLKPYDNQEFASQLAQFSQLEMLTDIRSIMEEQSQVNLLLTQTMSNTALPGMIGKSAKAYTDGISFDGESSAQLGYTLPYSASSGSISIYNENGSLIKTLDLDSTMLRTGDNTIEWDGTDSDGNIADEGMYSFEANVADGDGKKISTETFVNGKIEAVRFKTEGTVLVINGMEIPLGDISAVTSS